MTVTDNGEQMILWIGGSVSPQLLRDLYGVESPHDLSLSQVILLPFPYVLWLLTLQFSAWHTEFFKSLLSSSSPYFIASGKTAGTQVEILNCSTRHGCDRT